MIRALTLDPSLSSSQSTTLQAPAPIQQSLLAPEDGAHDSGAEGLVEIEFLLLSGKRSKWRFHWDTKVGDVRRKVWTTWPEDWRDAESLPPSPDSLRLLYLGRFLGDHETLGSIGITPGTLTIIHLTIRPLLTEDDEYLLKPSKKTSRCCLIS